MLFEPGYINSLRLPNRIIRSATWDGLATPDGDATTSMINRFEELVKGGVGLSMTGFCSVHRSGQIFPYMLGIESKDRMQALAKLTHRIHELGGIIGIQLSHGGVHARPWLLRGEKIRVVSMPEGVVRKERYRCMTSVDIAEMVAAFVDAAIRAKEAGFDLIQLQAGHGYLINQFLSPLTNRRTDAYGGCPQNRARFLFEICRRVRSAMGQAYPITAKINGSDLEEGGITLENSMGLVAQLHELGIDAVEVSGGLVENSENGPIRSISHTDQEGYFIDLARKIKEYAPAMQVIAVGGIRSGEMVQETLSSGSADYVALCRPLIRDSDLPQKWQSEKGYKSSCISCSKCFTPGLHGKGIQCVQRR